MLNGYSHLFYCVFYALQSIWAQKTCQPCSSSMLQCVLPSNQPCTLLSNIPNKPQSSSTIIEGCGVVLALPSLQGAMEDVHLGSILPHPLAPFNAMWLLLFLIYLFFFNSSFYYLCFLFCHCHSTITKKHEPAAPGQDTNDDISKVLLIWRLGTCGLYSKFLWDCYRFILLVLPLHMSYTH